MELIDTHCHLHDSEFYTPEQKEEFLVGARERGVERVICVGTNPTDAREAEVFAGEHEGVFWTFGIHPEYAGMEYDLPEGLEDKKLVAIGEVGLDYHYPGFEREKQIRLFEEMLELATKLNLPVSMHIREAFADAFGVLDNFPKITGAVHCFTGSKKELRRALERGFYIGVNGIATYATIPLPPMERMLLETDAPFLTPVPNRGKMNKPEYVRDIARCLAEKLGAEETIIAGETTKNAERLFRLGTSLPQGG